MRIPSRLFVIAVWTLLAWATPATAQEYDDGTTPEVSFQSANLADEGALAALGRVQLAEYEALAWMSRLVYCVNRQPDQYLNWLSQPGYGLQAHLANCTRWQREARAALDGWHMVMDQADYAAAAPQHAPWIEESNLVFAVYAKQIPGTTRISLVLAIRGTTSVGADWRSNLRWVTRILPGVDHYVALDAIRDSLLAQAKSRAEHKLGLVGTTIQVVTTGHSLGGGLAQLLAYGIEGSAAVVFNTTPVTGYGTVVDSAQVNCRLPIARVEHSGEVLKYLRDLLRNFYKWQSNMERVEYRFTNTRNFFSAHGMHHLARGFTDRVERGDTSGGTPTTLTAARARAFATEFDGAFRRAQSPPRVDCDCLYRRKSVPLDELVHKGSPVCERYVEQLKLVGSEDRR